MVTEAVIVGAVDKLMEKMVGAKETKDLLTAWRQTNALLEKQIEEQKQFNAVALDFMRAVADYLGLRDFADAHRPAADGGAGACAPSGDA